ncbi:MAG: polymerase ECF-type sigma factor [Phycisphaerales bacterium]|nr:polymerase ECF-type sigma factor [Phycisphaerales bacterium]
MGNQSAPNDSPVPPIDDPLVDVRLMRAVADGDRAALASLYDRYAARLMGLLVRMLGDRSDAEETLAELFFEVWDRADRYDPSRGCAATYLMTLARSRAIDRRRRRAARPDQDPTRTVSADAADADRAAAGSPSGAPAATPLAGVLFDEQATVVRSALAALENPQRQAIELSFFDGLTHSEIAAKLQRPLGTVKTWIRQGLGRLRDSLRKYESQT